MRLARSLGKVCLAAILLVIAVRVVVLLIRGIVYLYSDLSRVVSYLLD